MSLSITSERIRGFNRFVPHAKEDGVLTCGATTGFAPQTDLRHIFYRQVQVFGSTMGSEREFLDVMKCIFRGQLKPIIDRILPLSEARLGHELVEARKVFGKIVLVP